MKKVIKYLSAIALVSIIGMIFSSCKKDTPTTVRITVRDANNALVIGSGVSLYVDETSGGLSNTAAIVDDKVNKYSTTDYKGEATFDVSYMYKKGSAGVGILDLEVKHGTSFAKSVIKIEPEIENTQTVYIQ